LEIDGDAVDLDHRHRQLPAGSGDRLKFLFAKGQPVKVAVFAAKFDTVERAYILMTPLSGKPSNLMIVITHGFGQSDAYYSKLGYSDPLSPDLIRDVNTRFVLGRRGAQLMAAWSDYALLLPVRARGGGMGNSVPLSLRPPWEPARSRAS
jgi:hypothetical protein